MRAPPIAILQTQDLYPEYLRFVLQDRAIPLIVDNKCEIQIVFDAISSSTLHQLEHLPIHPKRMILTHNPCCEYIEDLLDFKPLALVQHPNQKRILEALEAVKAGRVAHQIQRSTANLSLKERIILRFISHGETNQTIAESLQLEHGSVRNIISQELLPKLQMANPDLTIKTRVHISRYYLGGANGLRIAYRQKQTRQPPDPETQALLDAAQTRRENEMLRRHGFEPDEKELARATLETLYAHEPTFVRIMYGVQKEPILPTTYRSKPKKSKK